MRKKILYEDREHQMRVVIRECLPRGVLTRMNLDCGILGCIWVILHSTTEIHALALTANKT